jgi:hypothetical protein
MIEHFKAKYNTEVTSISADNAALSVIRDVATLYETKYPEAPRITINRDPSHCLDLPNKDSAKVQVMAELLEVAKAIVKLCKTEELTESEAKGRSRDSTKPKPFPKPAPFRLAAYSRAPGPKKRFTTKRGRVQNS